MTGEPITRRSALAASAAALVAPRVVLGRPAADAAEIERVRAIARKAGLGEFRVSRNDQYLAIGDAPDGFRQTALRILSGLAKDYLEHFKFKKFAVEKPVDRMTLVILADRAAFGAYLGAEPDALVGGTYDPDANDLTFFDNRGPGSSPQAEKDNTLVLFHEATHQLAFNTGLLRRRGDIPLAIAEGIANYAEVRGPNGQPKIGAVNARRLAGLSPRGDGVPVALPPVATLIVDDDRLRADETKQLGYSEAWLLVHFLMQSKKLTPKFVAYLKAISPRDDPADRLQDWAAHFGDPAAMDRDLAEYLRRRPR